jgi:hypothetical protein
VNFAIFYLECDLSRDIDVKQVDLPMHSNKVTLRCIRDMFRCTDCVTIDTFGIVNRAGVEELLTLRVPFRYRT